ncbi:FISUMP domain-containing protein [Elizabethkingia anophelis]|uniref:FISUMP domain-containing protein n=1 Tax=Elizabethkingia anophelis TaxID=1117645 RepID=UPI0032096937
MRKELSFTSGAAVIAFLGLTSLTLTSCRSNDTEGNLLKGGVASVKMSLTGTEYSGTNGTPSAQASLKSVGVNVGGDTDVQRHGVMLSPSMILEAELSPSSLSSSSSSVLSSSSIKKSAQASTKLNTLAAVGDNPIGPGMMFRVIAYRQSDGTYQDSKDYKIGQPAAGLTLDVGAAYNLVAYSYGTATLPAITPGETTDIASAQVSYDNANPDFMYQNISYTPNNPDNTVNFTLRHKVSLITTTINSMVGNINSITGAFLSPHNLTGTIPLSTGVMTNRNTAINQNLNFAGAFPSITATADPVFVNADTAGNLGGTFSASINVNGTTKTVNLPNTFKITPEYKSDLNINLRTCGAYLGPNQTQYTEFMCQNLGATAGIDPFSPEAGNHGLKVQWGRNITGTNGVYYYSQASDQANSGTIAGWSQTNAANGAWNSGTETNPVKNTANDPCPSGYRVPTRTEWQAVIDNNSIERTDTALWTNSPTNYSSALYITNPQGVSTLMLPAAGYRHNADGALLFRGNYGFYWSSGEATSLAYALYFHSSSVSVSDYNRAYGFSVRCIKDQSASTVNGGNTSWSSSGNINLTTTY